MIAFLKKGEGISMYKLPVTKTVTGYKIQYREYGQ